MADPITAALAIGGMAATAIGTQQAAKGVKQAGEYNYGVAKRNEKAAQQKAKLVKLMTERDIIDFRSQFRVLNKAAAQRFMKSGIVATSGTALEGQMANAIEAEKDIQKMKYNAEANASEIREKGVNERLRGEMALYESKVQAQSIRMKGFGSLLGQGMQAREYI